MTDRFHRMPKQAARLLPSAPHIARSGLALNMKLLLKILVIGGLLGLVAWGMLYISSEENSIHLNGDWGIAKDKPVR